MKAEDLKKDVLYWVGGQGPMRLAELPDPPRKTTVTLKTPAGVNYYADKSQIIKPLEAKLMRTHIGEMRARLPVRPILLKWLKELEA